MISTQTKAAKPKGSLLARPPAPGRRQGCRYKAVGHCSPGQPHSIPGCPQHAGKPPPGWWFPCLACEEGNGATGILPATRPAGAEPGRTGSTAVHRPSGKSPKHQLSHADPLPPPCPAHPVLGLLQFFPVAREDNEGGSSSKGNQGQGHRREVDATGWVKGAQVISRSGAAPAIPHRCPV